MARKKRKAKAPKPPKLTPNKLAFLEELRLLHNRANRWEIKKGIRFTDFPQMPDIVYKEDIARVKAIRFNNFTPQQIHQYQKEYRYFHGYTPPTEDDFYNNTPPPEQPEPEWNDDWGEQEQQPQESSEELKAWFEEKINQIAQPGLMDPNVPKDVAEDRKQKLKDFMHDAQLRMGDRQFKEFLLDEENFADLQAAADEYINESNGNDKADLALNRFLTLLNAGRPLTNEQAETAEFYGYVEFDYTGTLYDE